MRKLALIGFVLLGLSGIPTPVEGSIICHVECVNHCRRAWVNDAQIDACLAACNFCSFG